MHSITYDEALQLYEDFPRPLRHQKREIDGISLELFTYVYAFWPMFRDTPATRNLRGVVFDGDTKELVSLPFHKFFNVNENEELKEEALTFNGLLMDKEDGSMAQATSYKGRLITASRMSLTGYVHQGVKNLIQQNPLLEEYIHAHPELTFLFEYLDPKNQIVLHNPIEELVFINARHKVTGAYHFTDHAGLIPTRSVKAVRLKHGDWSELKDSLSTLIHAEGYVLQLENDLVKVKGDWYRGLHRTLTDFSPLQYLTTWLKGNSKEYLATLDAVDFTGALAADYLQFIKDIEDEYPKAIEVMVEEALKHETTKSLTAAFKTKPEFKEPIYKVLFDSVMHAFRDGNISVHSAYERFLSYTSRPHVLTNRNALNRIIDALTARTGRPITGLQWFGLKDDV